MKKLLAVIMMMCMLIALAACGGGGGEEEGDSDAKNVAITNDLDCGVEDIYVVTTGAESWGEDATGYIDAGVGAFLYLEDLFGSNKQEVDILVVDEFDNGYQFHKVSMKNGDEFYIKIDDAGEVTLIKNGGKEEYVAEITEGDPYADICNELDETIAELYIYPSDSAEEGEPVATDLEFLDHYEIAVAEELGNRSVSVNILVVLESGGKHIFNNVTLKDGSEYAFDVDEMEYLIFTNDTFGGEYTADVVDSGEKTHLFEDLEGVWEDTDAEIYMLFYPDMTWNTISYKGEILNDGQFEFYGEEVLVYVGEESFYLYWDEYDELSNEEEGAYLSYVCDFESDEYQELLEYIAGKQAFFEQNGYEINYALGDGEILYENGACTMAEEGQYFATIPIYFDMYVESYDNTGDGFVEIVFTKEIYLDSYDYPDFMDHLQYTLNIEHDLYDYYTGYELPDTEAFGNTSQGDNCYYYEYESQGRTICVDYNFSTEWVKEDDFSFLLTMKHFVRMPADYDGLVYGQRLAYSDYDSYLQGTMSDPGVGFKAIEAEAAEGAIFCRLNELE